MLQVIDVAKRYDAVTALDGVNLTIEAGQICSLLGQNGAGKTTLSFIIVGLLRPDEGTVLIGGVDAVARRHETATMLGFAPQELAVYPTLTVREGLEHAARLAGVGRAAIGAQVDRAAELLGLTELLDRRAGRLSGGEQRRLHSAMALIHRPRLLLLDEPTAGVDVQTRIHLLGGIRDLAVHDGTAVLYTTHYLTEVEGLGGVVAIIDAGRIVARGSVDQLVSQHARPVIELHFHGPAPTLDGSRLSSFDGFTVVDDMLRIPSEDAAADLGEAIALLGMDAQRLRAVEILRPTLESAFLAVTGRRYGEAQPTVSRQASPGSPEPAHRGGRR